VAKDPLVRQGTSATVVVPERGTPHVAISVIISIRYYCVGVSHDGGVLLKFYGIRSLIL
jgi:hypothetical protein